VATSRSGKKKVSVWVVTNTLVDKIMCFSILDFLTFEDGTDRMPRNVGTELPPQAA